MSPSPSPRPRSSLSKANIGATPILGDPLLLQNPKLTEIANQLANWKCWKALQDGQIRVHRRESPPFVPRADIVDEPYLPTIFELPHHQASLLPPTKPKQSAPGGWAQFISSFFQTNAEFSKGLSPSDRQVLLARKLHDPAIHVEPNGPDSNTASFAGTNLNGTNFPIPDIPKIASRRPNIYPTGWERMQTSLNAAETGPVSLDPHSSSRHRVHNTNGPLVLPPRLGLFPKLGPFPIPGRSEFVNTVLTKGGSRYTSHNTLFESSQIPALASVPPQPQLQSESNLATPPGDGATPVDFLYAQIKEHAPFMVGLSGVLGGVAHSAVCSDKTKGHPLVCYALSTLRIYSFLLNLGAITTLALLLLFIPRNTPSFRYLWFLWVGLFVLDSILTFFQIVLFSWPEGVQVGILVLVAAVCVLAGIIFCLECYKGSRTVTGTDIEQAN